MRAKFAAALASCAWAVGVAAQQPAPVVIDAFDSVSQWTALPADGVEITIHPDSGRHGRSMRLDFDFHGHGGYAVVRRAVNLAIPENYEFSFAIRGEAPVNTLEFKLADSTGENVWWSNTPDFVFPREWRTITRKKRHISFAWGPTTDRELRRAFAIEFAITAGTGGKGSVWLDDLTLTPLDPPTPYTLIPRVTASAHVPGHVPSLALDGSAATAWRAPTASGGAAATSLTIDFLARREFGGLVIDWEPGRRPNRYSIRASNGEMSGSGIGQVWTTIRTVNRAVSPPGLREYLHLPEIEARYLELVVDTAAGGGGGFGVREIAVKPLEWAPTTNDLLLAMAADALRGSYPKYLSNEQSYWTVMGVDRDVSEALINEEGMIEVGRAEFSIEPFLYVDGRLLTWNDARITVLPDQEALPLPQVRWIAAAARGELELLVSAFVDGSPDSSVLRVRYRVTDLSGKGQAVKLYLALRPLQVNPPWQFLNQAGGFARVDSMELSGQAARVGGNKFVHSLTSPAAFGAVAFDEGDIVAWLRRGELPPATSLVDPLGHAAGAFVYDVALQPGKLSDSVEIAIPLNGGPLHGPLIAFEARAENARSIWREKLDNAAIELPASANRYVATMRATLAHIFINRDSAAIQPGSRSYSRSWIRDGSLTSTALLRAGHASAVKEFIEWFAPFQYDNGKVPCCVDEQGATPVPENDSHGQFIYLVAEYYRHTGDTAVLRRMWPHVAQAVSYMDSLRRSRMTERYVSGPDRIFYGLMPESISHEGYSAKPMHSYWDDFFALRGFKDAAFIARVLRRPEAVAFARITADFRRDLTESIQRVMATRGIDYIPGAAELADFDPTSTTVAVSPLAEGQQLFPEALQRTFDRYFAEARARARGAKEYEAYTPYELRAVGTFVQLGQRERAHELLDFFFRDQRPAAWHQWAEVVFRDPGTPKFIGDMPHTWVGSDYIRSFLDMLAFERESDSSLVVAAGVKAEWLTQEPGVRVSKLSTHYGLLSYDARMAGHELTVNIGAGVRVPPGGILISSPQGERVLSAVVNGAPAAIRGRDVVVGTLPATVTIRYAP